MLIRMLSHVAGPGFDIPAGGVTDRFPDAEAIRMISAGMAVPVDGGSQTEHAITDTTRKETRRRRKVQP